MTNHYIFYVYREEGTIPYIPEIPISTESMINYNQSIDNIIGIHSTPAGLESTSLVLAYGLGKFGVDIIGSGVWIR